jgi:hypothetical protein
MIMSMSHAPPNSVMHGPTRTVVDRMPVPSSSIDNARANCSRPDFVAV